MGLLLSHKHGVNPHLTFCPRCHKDGQELILTGSAHHYQCASCGMGHIGRPTKGQCVKCYGFSLEDKGEIDSYERLPGDLCQACKTERKQFAEEIKRGGVPIRCKDCGMEGVIKAHHPLAQEVRKTKGEVGLEYTKATGCPKCGQEG